MHVRRHLVLPVLTSLAALVPPGVAHADGPAGAPCLNAVRENGAVTEAVLAGGPIAATGTLTCTVQVGAATHSGADTVSASASGVGVVVLEPTGVWYPTTTQPAYICTEFTPALGAPWYWTPGPDDLGEWSTDPDVPCGVLSPDPVRYVEGIVQLVLDLYDALCQVDLCVPTVDPWVCPVLASFQTAGPVVVIDNQGDVYVDGDLVWDCPPYNWA